MSVQSKTAAFFKKNKKDSSLLPQQFRVGYSFHCQCIYFLMSWHTSLVVESWCMSKILSGCRWNWSQAIDVKETELSQVLHFWILGIKHIQTLGLQCLYKAKQQLSLRKTKRTLLYFLSSSEWVTLFTVSASTSSWVDILAWLLRADVCQRYWVVVDEIDLKQ